MNIKNDKKLTKKRLYIFTFLSICLGWAVVLSIPLAGLTYGDTNTFAILAIMMFTPAISSLLTRIFTKEGFKNLYLRPNFKGNIKKYLVVFFGPSILLLLSGVFYFFLFPSNFDSQFTQIKKTLAIHGPAGLTATTMLFISSLQVVVIGPIINIIPTLGEELGWRGYLLPKLRKLVSDRYALIISGAIWGFWHLPAVVLGHNYGTAYFGYPWLGIFAMIIFCIVLGIIEGYATIKLNSVIPAAMIHSTVNAGAALPIMVAKEGFNSLLGPAITGLVGGLPFIALAIFLYLRIDKERKGQII